MVFYQLVTRTEAGWDPFEPVTASWTEMTYQFQLATRYHAPDDVAIVHACSAYSLMALVRACRRTGGVECALEDLAYADAMSASISRHPLDVRRWVLESGEGGDHDVPYTFELPRNLMVLLKWSRLLARAHLGQLAR
jgi:hypothetical protein